MGTTRGEFTGYLDVEYDKSQELIEVQTRVIEELNPIRLGMRDKDRARLEDATGETKTNLLNFGYRSVGNLFRPHLTITRFFDPETKTFEALPPQKDFERNFESIGIFDMGDNGTCTNLIASWNFK